MEEVIGLNKEKWVSYDCYVKEAEGFEREVKKLLKANKLLPKYPNIKNIYFNYTCKCGFEEIQKPNKLDPEVSEFNEKVNKLLKTNKLSLKCPNCRKNMSIIFNYICKCGFKEIQKR